MFILCIQKFLLKIDGAKGRPQEPCKVKKGEHFTGGKSFFFDLVCLFLKIENVMM